jgi:AraC-like DNA-binding protein
MHVEFRYLQATLMSVDDLGWKVGFSDAANLRRAVRRRTNKTVNELRSNRYALGPELLGPSYSDCPSSTVNTDPVI